MTLRLNGTTSGYTEIDAPLVAGNNTIVLPSSNGSANQLLKNGSTAGSLEFSSNVFIDSSGRLGVGTSSPTQLLTVGGTTAPTLSATPTAIRLDNTYTGSPATNQKLKFYLYNDGSESYGITVGDAADFQYWAGGTATGSHRWFTSNTERMRIDSGGNIITHGTIFRTFSGATVAQYAYDPGTGLPAAGQIVISCKGNDGAGGSNGVGLTRAATSWSAYSDERAKADLVPIIDGLNKVSTLRSVTGRYSDDETGTSRSFLIAQDVQAVLPEAVDASNPDKLNLRYTETIPLLVAALKEAKERIETQSAAIAALEAKVAALEVTP
jgi:hypothetical protein